MMGYAVQQKRTHYVISWGTPCKNGRYGMQVVVARRAANIAAKPSNHAMSLTLQTTHFKTSSQ